MCTFELLLDNAVLIKCPLVQNYSYFRIFVIFVVGYRSGDQTFLLSIINVKPLSFLKLANDVNPKVNFKILVSENDHCVTLPPPCPKSLKLLIG
jgi:hypothetical protein